MPPHVTWTTTTSVRVKRTRTRHNVGAILNAWVRKTDRQIDRTRTALNLLTTGVICVTALTLAPTRNAATVLLSLTILLGSLALLFGAKLLVSLLCPRTRLA